MISINIHTETDLTNEPDYFLQWNIDEPFLHSISEIKLVFDSPDELTDELYKLGYNTNITIIQEDVRTLCFKPVTQQGIIYLWSPLKRTHPNIEFSNGEQLDFFCQSCWQTKGMMDFYNAHYKPTSWIKLYGQMQEEMPQNTINPQNAHLLYPLLQNGYQLPVIVIDQLFGYPAKLNWKWEDPHPTQQHYWTIERSTVKIPCPIRNTDIKSLLIPDHSFSQWASVPPSRTSDESKPDCTDTCPVTRWESEVFPKIQEWIDHKPSTSTQPTEADSNNVIRALTERAINIFTQQGSSSNSLIPDVQPSLTFQHSIPPDFLSCLKTLCPDNSPEITPQQLLFYSLFHNKEQAPHKKNLDLIHFRIKDCAKTHPMLLPRTPIADTLEDRGNDAINDFIRIINSLLKNKITTKDFEREINFLKKLLQQHKNLSSDDKLSKEAFRELQQTYDTLFSCTQTSITMGGLTDATRTIINDSIIMTLLSPHRVSHPAMRLILCIDNQWKSHIHKGILHTVIQWPDNQWKQLFNEPETHQSSDQLTAYLSWAETFLDKDLPKHHEFTAAITSAKKDIPQLSGYWKEIQEIFQQQFHCEFPDFIISLIMQSIIHQNDGKVPATDETINRVKERVLELQTTLPESFSIDIDVFPIEDEFKHLQKEMTLDKHLFTETLMDNTFTAYLINQILHSAYHLDEHFLLNGNGTGDSSIRFYRSIENILQAIKQKSPITRQRAETLSVVKNLQQILHHLIGIISHFTELEEAHNGQAAYQHNLILATGNYLTQLIKNPLNLIMQQLEEDSEQYATRLTSELKYVFAMTKQELFHQTTDIAMHSKSNIFSALEEVKETPDLTYLWLFLKSAVDGKKREMMAQARPEQYLPVDIQLRKPEQSQPILAQVVIGLPSFLLRWIEKAVTQGIWKKNHAPVKDGTWRGWSKPVDQWTEKEIRNFIARNGWLKINENFSHWTSLGREKGSHKGIETIPTCNSMVITSDTLLQLQFFSEMALRLTQIEAEKQNTSHHKLALNAIEDIMDEDSLFKISYREAVEYRRNIDKKTWSEHKQQETSGKEIFLADDIIKLLLSKTVTQKSSIDAITRTIDRSTRVCWNRLLKNYFRHYEWLLPKDDILPFPDTIDNSRHKAFKWVYSEFRKNIIAVISCDFARSSLRHTFQEIKFVVHAMGLSLIPPQTDSTSADPDFTTVVTTDRAHPEPVIINIKPDTEEAESQPCQPSAVTYPEKIFETAGKLLSDNINALGTHMGSQILHAPSQPIPDHLDKRVEKLQKKEAFSRLKQLEKQYHTNMKNPQKKQLMLRSMEGFLTESRLSFYWRQMEEISRSCVDKSAEFDKLALPVYIVWCTLTGGYLRDGNAILSSVVKAAEVSSDILNDIILLGTPPNETAYQIPTISMATASSANQHWVNATTEINNILQNIIEQTFGYFGSSANGLIYLNLGSSLLSITNAALNSVLWFDNQLTIMEKTARLEDLPLITGHLSAKTSEHYAAMELGEQNISHIHQTSCECRDKNSFSCKKACQCICEAKGKIHDCSAVCVGCPQRCSEKLCGYCCDLNEHPCCRNCAFMMGYCCCGGMCCAPLEAIIGDRLHTYMDIVNRRMNAAAGRTIGTGTRTIPYNFIKEILNIGRKEMTTVHILRVTCLILDGIIAVAENSEFTIEAHIALMHDLYGKAVSKLYSPEAFNKIDKNSLESLWGYTRAAFFTRDKKVVDIPYYRCDKCTGWLCFCAGAVKQGYSIVRVVQGIIEVGAKPIKAAASFSRGKVKSAISSVAPTDWKMAYNQQLDKVNMGMRTIREKVPSNLAIYTTSKGHRLSASQRASNPGINSQTTLGSMKNAILSPISREAIQSGDPGNITMAGIMDAAEGFIVDAGNGQQSDKNMLNVPPTARLTGHKMVENCWIQALSSTEKIPKAFERTLKQKTALCCIGGLAQSSAFINYHLTVIENPFLQEDWNKLKMHVTKANGKNYFMPHALHYQFLAGQLKDRTHGHINIHENPGTETFCGIIQADGSETKLPVTKAFPHTTKYPYIGINQLVDTGCNIDYTKRDCMNDILPVLLQLEKYKTYLMRYLSEQKYLRVLSGRKVHDD
ncbi:hypothetical protein CI610_02597 [invertebrate metagenome]|uniref:Uncharacterized protein n=1 Tax=invertebrate metagenome TaxID=1711999 RepID=A0A2H9T5H7_9ZZZZ